MFRMILCVAVASFVCADVALAKGKGGKKAGGPVIGTVGSVDAAAGSVTVTVTTKKGSKDNAFTVADTTAVVITNADATTKQLKGKDGLKDAAVKAGASIQVTCDTTGAVTEVAVGGTYAKQHKKNK